MSQTYSNGNGNTMNEGRPPFNTKHFNDKELFHIYFYEAFSRCGIISIFLLTRYFYNKIGFSINYIMYKILIEIIMMQVSLPLLQ